MMKSNLLDEIISPSLSRLDEQPTGDLTRKQPQITPQTQRQTRPAPAEPLPPGSSTNPILDDAALYGVAGLAVCGLAPHSEAHPAAILLQLLAAFGNAVGPAPHCMVDATRHPLNLFVVLVGESSKARKGTSWNQIARLFAEVDQPWLSARVTADRLTAAGLIQTLRDQQPSSDRRLLVLCEEFATVLRSLKGSSGHLSPMLRRAWDSGHLPAIHLHDPVKATGTHISLIAHITQRELTSNLHPTEAHNGFANRCLWACIERSNCLPDGGNLTADDLAPIARELRAALEWVNSTPELRFRRDAAAGELWRECYPSLSQLQPGLRGAATSRAEAQVLRLSALYAALDSTTIIALPHLEAALAVWRYCYDSASLLFGMSTGDPVADRIRQAVEASGSGLSKSQILRLFHGHVQGDRIDAALETLVACGVLDTRSEPTGGRPSTHWAAVAAGEDEENNEPEPW
jgi:hypothetical protein